MLGTRDKVGAALLGFALLVQVMFPFQIYSFGILWPTIFLPVSYVVSLVGCWLLNRSWSVLVAHSLLFIGMLYYLFSIVQVVAYRNPAAM